MDKCIFYLAMLLLSLQLERRINNFLKIFKRLFHCCVMMGDFNVRVGSRGINDDDEWYKRGPHRYGEFNEAGRELLSFPLLSFFSERSNGMQYQV